MLCEKLDENIEFKIPQIQGAYFCLYNIALDLTSNQAILFLVKDAKRILITQLSRNVGGIRGTNLCIDFANLKNVVFLAIKGSVHIIGGYKKQFGGDFKQDQQTKAHALITQQKDQKMKYGHNKKQKMPQQPTKQIGAQGPTQNQPIRRSARARAPSKPTPPVDMKAAKREKEELKNMAKYFECNLDEDEDDSFSEQNQDQASSQSQSEENEEIDQQQFCAPSNDPRKIKNKPSKPKQNAPVQQKIQKIQEQITDKSLNYSVPTRNPYQ